MTTQLIGTEFVTTSQANRGGKAPARISLIARRDQRRLRRATRAI